MVSSIFDLIAFFGDKSNNGFTFSVSGVSFEPSGVQLVAFSSALRKMWDPLQLHISRFRCGRTAGSAGTRMLGFSLGRPYPDFLDRLLTLFGLGG
ncbi:hypothetical protein U1Q18_032083 [Sarracenia purpurea var. burkii]